MDKELFDYTAEKVDELLAASSSSQETRDAAQGWKDAIAAGADADAATKTLLDIIDRHHTTIDELIGFAQGPAKDLMGEEKAAGMLTAGVLWGYRDEKELLENGADLILTKPEEIPEVVFGTRCAADHV